MGGPQLCRAQKPRLGNVALSWGRHTQDCRVAAAGPSVEKLNSEGYRRRTTDAQAGMPGVGVAHWGSVGGSGQTTIQTYRLGPSCEGGRIGFDAPSLPSGPEL